MEFFFFFFHSHSVAAVLAPIGTLESMRYGDLDSFDLTVYFDGVSHTRYCDNTGNYLSNDAPPVKDLTRFLGKNTYLQPYVENTYGLSLAPAIHVLVPQRVCLYTDNHC